MRVVAATVRLRDDPALERLLVASVRFIEIVERREADYEKFRLGREMSNQTPSIVDCEQLTCPRSFSAAGEVDRQGTLQPCGSNFD